MFYGFCIFSIFSLLFAILSLDWSVILLGTLIVLIFVAIIASLLSANTSQSLIHAAVFLLLLAVSDSQLIPLRVVIVLALSPILLILLIVACTVLLMMLEVVRLQLLVHLLEFSYPAANFAVHFAVVLANVWLWDFGWAQSGTGSRVSALLQIRGSRDETILWYFIVAGSMSNRSIAEGWGRSAKIDIGGSRHLIAHLRSRLWRGIGEHPWTAHTVWPSYCDSDGLILWHVVARYGLHWRVGSWLWLVVVDVFCFGVVDGWWEQWFWLLGCTWVRLLAWLGDQSVLDLYGIQSADCRFHACSLIARTIDLLKIFYKFHFIMYKLYEKKLLIIF